MSESKAHVALLVDFASLSREAIAGAPDAATVAAALLRYAGGVGRVTLARGYADWSARPDDMSAVQAAHVAPVLVAPGASGGDRAHVHLVVDAIECLFAGGEPDAYVLASGDARLLPLVHALRADGCDVVVVAPAGAAVADLRGGADASATVEEALAGAVGPASAPRVAEEEEEEGEEEAAEEVEAAAPPPSRPSPRPPRDAGRPPHRFEADSRGYGPPPRGDRRDGPGRGDRYDRTSGPPPRFGDRMRGPQRPPQSIDFARYDWASFVRLIDELEHRLPFVGVRYLVNKVLGPRNCGVDDPRVKRDLINRAVDDGILEMYEVGNVGDRSDPVTACRLDRRSAGVVAVLGGETATPVVPEARDDDAGGEAGDEGEGLVEGGLPLDGVDDEAKGEEVD